MARRLGLREAKQRAGRYCAYRERSSQELLEKLMSWGLTDGQAESLVEELSQEGFVDDQRFANAFCHDKFEFNGWGKHKIKAHLNPHKLDQIVVNKALERIDAESYKKRLHQLAHSKWKRLSKETLAQQKQKTIAFLIGRGFESDLIWEVVGELATKGH